MRTPMLVLLIGISSVCFSQKASITVVLKNGPEQKYILSDIRELTFSHDSLLIEYVNGSVVAHPLSSILRLYSPQNTTNAPGGKTPRQLFASFALQQNYPNPFNPTTTIQYELKELGDVETSIYDIRGQMIRILENGTRQAGTHLVVWDGKNNSGVSVSSGTYFCRVRFNGAVITKKMALIR